MDNAKLIKLVYEQRALWDTRDLNYNNRGYTKKLWNDIANTLHTANFVVKNKWQNMRDTYRKEYQKQQRTQGKYNKPSVWRHYHSLKFLDDGLVLKNRSAINRQQISTRQPEGQLTNDDDCTNSDKDYEDFVSASNLCQVDHEIGEEPAQDNFFGDQYSTVNGNSECVLRLQSFQSVDDSRPDKVITDSPETNYQNYSETNMDSVGNPTQFDRNSGVRVANEDYHFLISLLPHLTSIPKRRKLQVRQKLQQVLLDEQQCDNSQHTATSTNTTVDTNTTIVKAHGNKLTISHSETLADTNLQESFNISNIKMESSE